MLKNVLLILAALALCIYVWAAFGGFAAWLTGAALTGFAGFFVIKKSEGEEG